MAEVKPNRSQKLKRTNTAEGGREMTRGPPKSWSGGRLARRLRMPSRLTYS
jgi:hypothetical protein